MCGWLSTSDPSALLTSLHRQPVLAVLRPSGLDQARLQLSQLQQAGLWHVELAVSSAPGWVAMVRQLATAFPALRLGAASVRSVADLEAALAAGLGYAVSPILDRALLERAAAAGITLVPGVFSPSEISQAVAWGAPAVKLFPAATLGPGYWSALAGPLAPLPFCIAAGGLAATDAAAWFRAGVNAVALGGSLFEAGPESAEAQLRPGLAELLAWVHQRLH